MSNLNKVSSAYSDDGVGLRERSNTEELGGHQRLFGQRELRDLPLEVHYVASEKANASEYRRQMERPDDDAGAIYEAPDEDELASSPPGSLSHQEIMSEHI